MTLEVLANVDIEKHPIHPVILATKGEDGVYRIAKTSSTTGAIPVAPLPTSRSLANAPYVRDYSGANVLDSAWAEIVTTLTAAVSRIHVFDSCGYQVRLATGAAASEAEIFRIAPGGDGIVDIAIPAGTRLAIRSASGTIASGTLIINFLS